MSRATTSPNSTDSQSAGVAETNRDGIVIVDAAGRFTFMSPAAERLFGFTCRTASLTADGRTNWNCERLDGSAAALDDCPFQRAKLSGQVVSDARLALRRPDGSRVMISVNVVPQFDEGGQFRGAVVAVWNMTRQAYEESLLAQQELYAGLVNSLDGIVWEVDVETMMFTFVSSAGERILGYPLAQWTTEKDFWPRHIHPEDREWAVTYCLGATEQKRDHSFEYRMIAADGRIVWIHDAVTVISDGKHPRKLRGIMLDVTEKNRLREQLQASQKMEAIGRLAAGIAHDFNNLLAVICGYSESIARRLPDQSPLKAHSDEILRAAERGASLTRQLQAFSRRQVARPQRLNLNTVVRDMETMIRAAVRENVPVRVEVEESLRPISADPVHLEQVLVNLAINARDAMPGGGTLWIRTGNVEFNEADASRLGLHAGQYARLSIIDTGIGMDAQTQSRVFEPFFTTKSEQGTGLGLAIVYGIAQQYGGAVTVESSPGHGARFDVYFPVAESAD
jgi:PAS domain S-box-containing protein